MEPEWKSLPEHYQPEDVQEMWKDLLEKTPERTLEAEIEDHLGYSKYDYKNKTGFGDALHAVFPQSRCRTPDSLFYKVHFLYVYDWFKTDI